MSAPAFTPGPWRFEERVNEYGHQGEGAPILGTVRGSGEKPDGGEHIAVVVSDLEEAEADARLIAAAPELYEALGVCLAMAERALKASMNLNGKSPYDIGMDALRKARGEQ